MSNDRELLAEMGRRVRARRDLMGLAQADLAGRGGPAEATVSRLERGDGSPPRQQTQRQLEKALALPPGAVADFLQVHRQALATGPNVVSTRPQPFGDYNVHVLDFSLAHVLTEELGLAAGPGQTLDWKNLEEDEWADIALRALRIAGRTRPAFPLPLVHLDSNQEYVVDGPGELYSLLGTGDYLPKYEVPGLNYKPYEHREITRTVLPVPALQSPDSAEQGAVDSVPTSTVEPPADVRRSGRTRINPDGSVERAPLGLPLVWRTVGDLGEHGIALARALDTIRDLPPTDAVFRANYYLSQVLQELADGIDEPPTPPQPPE